MKKFLVKNERGFTLVELMVVVAIIGILSAIAVPNFKKYQAKAKQSEAKIQLAAAYNAEIGASADYDTYATCLIDLGYEVPPKGYYWVGFSAHDGGTAGTVTQRSGACAATVAVTITPSGFTYAVSPLTILTANNAGALIAATNLTPGGSYQPIPSASVFTAVALGNISSTNTVVTDYDKWVITQSKSLVNVKRGY